jgi:hypothetical protein
VGWEAGHATDSAPKDEHAIYVAGTYVYTGAFSFQVTMGLADRNGARMAHEHLWAKELMATLAIAGSFFEADRWATELRCDLSLTGLEGAEPTQRSGRRATDAAYQARGYWRPRVLAESPDYVAAALLDRLLVSFLAAGVDVFADLKHPSWP